MTSNFSKKNTFIYPSGTTADRPSAVNNGFIYFNTTVGALQIYQNGSWYVLTNINAPGVPTSVVATNQGSGRGYNNGQASIAFTPATETFGFPSLYTVTPTPTTSPATFTGTSTPVTVTGLSSSTQYTYTVSATNNTGSSSASSASSGVTATTVPQAPTIGAVTAGNATADVAFTANATGGSAITSYTATSTPGSITGTGSTSPITVNGLTNGTSYTFAVTATNANGTSTASAASSAATPNEFAPTGAYDSIATATVGTSGVVAFTSIPSTYTHLQIRSINRNDSGSTNVSDMQLRLGSANSADTGANYSRHELVGDGSAVYAGGAANSTSIYVGPSPRNGNASSIFGVFILDILDYANTNKNKTIRCLSGDDRNGSGEVVFTSGNWRNTAAINYVQLYIPSVSFISGTQFALYGIKGN
jgi:hypothetical protein